jgi:hypothetical protein
LFYVLTRPEAIPPPPWAAQAESTPAASENAPLAGPAPCDAIRYEACFIPTNRSRAVAGSWWACKGNQPRVCLVTVGSIEEGLVDHLIAHFKREYDLAILRGPALPVQPNTVRTSRKSPDAEAPQVNPGGIWTDIEDGLFKAAMGERENMNLIVLTPLDMQSSINTDWNYAFGQPFTTTHNGKTACVCFVSTYRMDDRVYGERYSDKDFADRVTKMVSKYVGRYYFGLPDSRDPFSAMYNNILGVKDLDIMSLRLTVGE